MEIKTVFCILFSGISMIMDLKWEKVSNYWIITGTFLSYCIQIFSMEKNSWMDSLAGMILPLLILFPLFIGKMLGTGDIKVYMVLGSIMGSGEIIQCIAVSFIIGAIISIPILLIRCNVRERLSYFFSYVASVIQTRTIPPYLAPGKQPENIHFTIPIFLSIVFRILKGGTL